MCDVLDWKTEIEENVTDADAKKYLDAVETLLCWSFFYEAYWSTGLRWLPMYLQKKLKIWKGK